ncbi:glycoside hydrolase family 2 TIM barrel-domain containing protein [Patulibacter sp. NPDC049589]|uniref:glycoside hydrolase family 2 protein n=1 Tax=Patulibacter sp. NPDC049589 TaxID=3154731 RepID=UPI003413664A
MHRPLRAASRVAALAVVLSALIAAPTHAQDVPPATTGPATPTTQAPATPSTDTARPVPSLPSKGGRYFAGPDDRWTVGGSWLIRRDQGQVGLKNAWQRQKSAVGWTPTTVPNVWNAGDNSPASQLGGITWYRRELRLPTIPKARRGGLFVLRFERVSVQAIVWVDGVRVRSHRGAYEPFQAVIPRDKAKDGQVNIVVRTDSRRTVGDLPPGSTQKDGTPGGGWWNDAGIPREVGLRYADQVDLSPVQITPDLPCPTCSGVVRYRVTATNFSSKRQRAEIVASVAGRSITLGRVSLRPSPALGRSHPKELTGTVKIPKPHVWSPKDPHLYEADVDARLIGGKRDGERVAHYRARTGIRSIRVKAGKLQLNFKDVDLRGTGVHEMDIPRGSALTDEGQDLLLQQVRDLGGLVIRGHYPFHPRILEEADRLGLLVWTEIPVYQVRQSQLARDTIREDALDLLKTTITVNAHHPSVFTWSIGNELTTNPGPPIVRYVQDARKVVDEYDPTRPMAYARQSGVKYGCVGAYGPVDLLGINDYFGWYGSPTEPLADPAQLGPFLDNLRKCNPNEAIMITETGAEANRDGPVTEPGTYAFQAAYAAHHFAVYRSRPWLSGAIWWGLREFRVRPNWGGGNPVPTPPWHGKGLLGRDMSRKPAWQVLHDEFGSVDQLAPAPSTPVDIPPSPPGRLSSDGTGEDGDPADGVASPGA